MGLIPKEIEAYYLQGGESERLSNEWGELEQLRTQAILVRYLAPAPAIILDVGGGAGAYAFPLARQGYEVHLIDPVELHLEQARSYAEASGVTLASIMQGDARQLNFPASSADAVLLLGRCTIWLSGRTVCRCFLKRDASLDLAAFSSRPQSPALPR